MTIKASKFYAAIVLLIAVSMSSSAQASDFMRVGERTAQPVGHYEFCQRLPTECTPQNHTNTPLKLTSALWSLINRVNEQVNHAITPVTDQELWGIQEFWSYPEHFGDCEDFVLEKRRRLIEAGIPASHLLITVVRQANGDGHAVLTIHTDRGDLVLDNLSGRILPWSATDYAFLKRQSASHAGQWNDINDGRAMDVGNVATTR